jgi:hypothetical protein
LRIGAVASGIAPPSLEISGQSRGVRGKWMESLPDDALIVRGGQNLTENFVKGSGVTVEAEGTLQGVSVNSAYGATVAELTAAIPQRL